VGGIHANDTRRGDFLYDNLTIAANVLEGARRAQVPRLLFLGSSCIYPRLAPQPMREEHLLTGPLEPTNEPYAIAKIAGLKLVESYNRQHGTAWLSAMPTNLYGPGDNYDLHGSHVLPAMIRKFHDAMVDGDHAVVLWGSGTARREFLHVDDLAEACLHILATCKPGRFPGDLINVGSGLEVTIAQLAHLVQCIVGHEGPIEWDLDKPDGTPRKLLDCTRIHETGWRPRISLLDGITAAYEDFIKAGEHARGVGVS
jgi:GDP-L-fucose synthase